MAWLSVYVIIGCVVAAISLMSSKPEQLSPLSFALAHALWPVTLIVFLVWVLRDAAAD